MGLAFHYYAGSDFPQGSVTAGHGVKTEENWTTLVTKWFQETFPQSNVTLINGAIPATGSDYYCKSSPFSLLHAT